ncbi:unnamed protein product [Rotaria sordida]|uniref:Cytochrome P450 n=2 Tax=Rotaria sordida TaxID=392033 RepID=A0A819IVR9_9BILA|nr:unnamed protein product [Rotaria sordida]
MFWFGPHRCIVFCRPEHAQIIFTDRHNFEQSPLIMPYFDLLCPYGISLLTGAKWKRHIRVMLPMFKHCCQSLTMNIIGFIGFDYDFDVKTDSPLKIAFEDFVSYAVFIMMMPWLPRWLAKRYLKFNWKYQRAHRFIRQVTEKIVEEEQNKQYEAENYQPKNLTASLVSSVNEDANDQKISSGLTRAEMLDEVLLSIMAGYGTTSAGLSWFIFFLSKNSHVKQRMKEELRQHNLMTTDDVEYASPLTEEKLSSLIYCECVTKEVFRLTPTISVTTRMVTSDTIIDNVPIHSGQIIFIGLLNIKTDERYWNKNPKEFIPERFLIEDKNYHTYAMVPFDDGHRACLGQDLAWIVLKLIIIRCMQRGIIFEDTQENTGGYEEKLACRPKNLAVRIRFDRH